MVVSVDSHFQKDFSVRPNNQHVSTTDTIFGQRAIAEVRDGGEGPSDADRFSSDFRRTERSQC